MSLAAEELDYLTARLGRSPSRAEMHIVAAEWSEHCSYKSSKKHLRLLPGDGARVIAEKGYDSGVLDVGDGYVVTAHIESHNHPSAVEPYGGAATGVGGVIRDILSAGTRPVAVLDGLRFGDARTDPKALWLLKNAVMGIADYGNCLGIPTIGGEIEFDRSYSGYAMVDVAAIGFGRRERLIRNHADVGDAVVLLGGSTGRDGIGGSQFASDLLDTDDGGDRSAVQIPDPFMEKLLIEAILEARDAGVINAMKDLGGGGLSCAISETAEALGVGIEMDVSAVHARESGMLAEEIMTSESQERMLIITSPDAGVQKIGEICAKFEVPCSVIGHVRSHGMMRVASDGIRVADMPADVVANARLLDLPSARPSYLDGLTRALRPLVPECCAEDDDHNNCDYTDILLRLLLSPNIASRMWAYGQYDHEVGLRTVVRPGSDASVLRLDNGSYLAVSMDGNPKHCYVDPRQGAIGCFEEACRNVVCTGASPIGMLDHLQFGDPTDPGVFWTFMESVHGIAHFARHMQIPCIGGKVSLYNETQSGPIKPTPVIAVLGLIPRNGDGSKGGRGQADAYAQQRARDGDWVFAVGVTRDEMGGSEYNEYIRGVEGGGRCPAVRLEESRRNSDAVLGIVRGGFAHMAHDCSKGGLAAAVSEACLGAGVGCQIHLGRVPYDWSDVDAARMPADGAINYEAIMFSESHSRYLIITPDEHADTVEQMLRGARVPYGRIGRIGGERIQFLDSDGNGTSNNNGLAVADLDVVGTRKAWSEALGGMIHGS